MTNVDQFLQMWETIKSNKPTKVLKAISKDDHEFMELKDKHGNKFEIKFYHEFYKEGE